MSVPFFFAPVEQIIIEKGKWEKVDYYGTPPDKVTFVDGGILSNFPINAFHEGLSSKKEEDKEKCEKEENTSHNLLRPTFGVKLGRDFITQDSNEKGIKQECFQTDNILSMSKSILETLRLSNEREFLAKNPDYQQLIKCIDVDENQAFNFAMDSATQQYLFWSGYKAIKPLLSLLKAKKKKLIGGKATKNKEKA